MPQSPPHQGGGAGAGGRASLEHEFIIQQHALTETRRLLETQNEKLRTAETETAALVQRYASLYEASPVGYAVLNGKGHIEHINPAGASLLGCTRQSLHRIDFVNFLATKKDGELFHEQFQRSRNAHPGDEAITTELHLRCHAGLMTLVQLTITPTAAAGVGESYLVTLIDITRSRKAEAALHKSEERLTSILAADAIISVDENQRMVFFNAGAEHMFGWTAAEAMGQPFSRLLPERFRAEQERQMDAIAKMSTLGELLGLRADGVEFPLEASISATVTVTGRLTTFILRDTSERTALAAEKHFLIQMGEHIRLATDAAGLMSQVTAAVGRYLQVERCFLAQLATGGDQFTVAFDYHTQDLGTMAGSHRMRIFKGDVLEDLLAGHIVTVADVACDARTMVQEPAYRRFGIGAYAVVPLMSEGQLLAAMVMTTAGVHEWTKSEVALLGTVAERVWLALEKLRLNEELRASAARFRTMAERVPVFMFTTTAAGESDYMNQRFLDYTGLTATAALGIGWLDALHPDDRPAAIRSWQTAVYQRKPFEVTTRFRAADGQYRWFRCTAHPVYNEQGSISKWFGSCADIDDLMRAQAELAAVNERLEERVVERTAQLASANKELHHEFMERQRLEHEITEISEQERRSLGEALHEGVCQHLAGVVMMATTLSDVFEQKADPEMACKLKEIANLIRCAANDARDVAKGLHPVDVDANGLVAALRDLAARFAVPGQTRCALYCSEPVPVHDNDVAMHLYRIVQEAVINASRHAHARNISIQLGIRHRVIMLVIIDDGTGRPENHDETLELGLKLMRYRASSIGATLTIEPRNAGGTVVRCNLPVPA